MSNCLLILSLPIHRHNAVTRRPQLPAGRHRHTRCSDGADLPHRTKRKVLFLRQCGAAECQSGLLLCRTLPRKIYAVHADPAQVQSGGAFDIDYQVAHGPQDRVILQGEKERQGDFVFTAQETGEYRFCFNNEISTFTDKIVDFEIAVRSTLAFVFTLGTNVWKKVENESRAELPTKAGSSDEQHSKLEESINKVSGHLSTISRNQKYFRTRENRNFSTVRSTERRIFNFSIIESGMMIAMAGLQVFIVRFFFQGARKGYV